MAVPADRTYLRAAMEHGHVGTSVLEIGSRDWQGGEGNMRAVVTSSGRTWSGCDIEVGPGVDFTLDILDDDQVGAVGREWGTVLLFNLLEHVYDPVTALTNSLRLVEPGGTAVICGPAIWELHGFPRDYWRPMPDFFTEYAARHGMTVGLMQWVLNEFAWIPGREPHTRLMPVGDQFPGRLTTGATYGKARSAVSIGLQRSLNLTGRFTIFPRVGLGLVLRAGAVTT